MDLVVILDIRGAGLDVPAGNEAEEPYGMEIFEVIAVGSRIARGFGGLHCRVIQLEVLISGRSLLGSER